MTATDHRASPLGEPGPAEPDAELAVLTAMVDAAGVLLVVMDSRALVVRVNAACAAAAGGPPAGLVGRPVWEALPGEDPGALRAHLAAVQDPRVIPAPLEQLWLTALGNRRRIAWTFGAARGPSAERWLVATGIDVTEQRRAEAAWRQLAHSDPLTGLPNRVALEAALAAHLDPDRGLGCGLLFCDLDAFKAANDRYGHAVGDELLVEVARRLVTCVRDSDLVARIGGDEFVILLPAAGAIETKAAASRVQRTVSRPYRLPPGPARIGVSVGQRVANAGEDPAEVLRDADTAMYAVKASRTAVRPPA